MVRMRSMIVMTVFGLASACLITNCPKGGKRSKVPNEIVLEPDKDRICVRCGPGMLGRCLGPAVCCGPHLGCLMASPGILSECQGAGTVYRPQGRPCLAPSGLGICASNGVCCDSESCRVDLSCEMELSADVCSTDEISLENPF